MLTIPGITPFSLAPYEAHTVNDAQVSGRFGASYVITKNTVIRGSFSNQFAPASTDILSTPPTVFPSQWNFFNGVYNGTVAPMHALRGKLVDASIEHQIGPRFVTRTNLFYKRLQNYGDSGVVGNSLLYNRQTVAAQDAYGVESRIDLKGSRDVYGFNGFLSNTVQWAFLRGSRQVTGGIYAYELPPVDAKYPDHDRRFVNTAGIGYRGRRNWWVLVNNQVMTGLQDERDPILYGPHPGRTPVIVMLNASAGFNVPEKYRQKSKLMPTAFDVRIENILNERVPTNLGSPFQGTRYTLPIRVLAGWQWQFGAGRDNTQLSQAKPTKTTLSGI
jgi:hypothetical protein